MTNKMYDLRRRVAQCMYDAMNGREIDVMDGPTPHLPHMLGITPIGEIHDPKDEEGTILDPSEAFWNEYTEDVETRRAVSKKIETAIRSLQKDGYVDITYPYGEEGDIIYVEISIPGSRQ